ncbi:agamous-like MADS-box protein AGL29 [Curcuma longa]|uniref:agamous-like MADS-box protein AGL29 n=1 Tax=Curcuma longa TaxID=136217 RepID=UPI003D9DF823
MARNGASSKGRRKIEMKKIQSEDARHVCFSKRKAGIFAKASDISTLCGVDVGIVMYSPVGNPYSFGSPTVDQVVDRFLLGNLLHDADTSLNLNHVNQQLSQEYMDLSNQLEAAKDRSVNLKERIANAQTQEFDCTRDINKLSLEQVDQLKNRYERLKVKTETRITEILNGEANPSMVIGGSRMTSIRNSGVASSSLTRTFISTSNSNGSNSS